MGSSNFISFKFESSYIYEIKWNKIYVDKISKWF